MAKIYASLFFLLVTYQIHSQNQTKSFVVKFINEKIQPDGVLDEAVWDEAESANDFYQYFPSDSVMAEQKTEIKMLYNSTTLFIFHCYKRVC